MADLSLDMKIIVSLTYLFWPVLSVLFWRIIIKNKDHRLKLVKTLIKDKLFNAIGRSNRIEYWLSLILIINANFILLIPNLLIFSLNVAIIIIIFLVSYILIILAGIRRLHDIGDSGWLYLLVQIFFPIGNVILGLFKGDEKENRFGPPSS